MSVESMSSRKFAATYSQIRPMLWKLCWSGASSGDGRAGLRRQQAVRREADALDAQQELLDRVAGAQRIVGAHPVLPAGEGRVVAAVGLVGDERRPAHQRLLDLGRQPQAEEVDQRQVDRDEEGVLGGVDHLVRHPAPEDAEIAGGELGDIALHPVGHRAAEDVVDLDLGVPVRRRHDARLLVADHQAVGHPLDRALQRVPLALAGDLTIQRVHLPKAGDAAPKSGIVGTAPKTGNNKGGTRMRLHRACAALALGLAVGPAGAQAQSGEITVWSWNIAASSLESVIAGFNAAVPGRHRHRRGSRQPAGLRPHARRLRRRRRGAARRALDREPRGRDLLGAVPRLLRQPQGRSAIPRRSPPGFPDFKRTELEVGDVAYAMPWDSGPGGDVLPARLLREGRRRPRDASRPGTTSSPPARR